MATEMLLYELEKLLQTATEEEIAEFLEKNI